jgi:hypothetical protein
VRFSPAAKLPSRFRERALPTVASSFQLPGKRSNHANLAVGLQRWSTQTSYTSRVPANKRPSYSPKFASPDQSLLPLRRVMFLI